MNSEDLQHLLQRPEGLKLDFKQEFYHIDHPKTAVQEREWGELIKDILALANGNVGTADQTGYLIIGAGDVVRPDGSRPLFDIGNIQISTKHLLEKVNAVAEPPFADLNIERLMIDSKRLLVITIPPSPHLHETKRQLLTRKGTYSERTILVRRSEHIYIASHRERMAIEGEKSRRTNSVGAIYVERSSSRAAPKVTNQSIQSYLAGIIRSEEDELDHRYISLSGTTQRLRADKSEFPRGLIPNEFRFIDLHQDPQLQNPQLLEAIEDALEIHHRFVLLGAPGSGKTLTLRKLQLDTARWALENTPERVPILINLAQWPETISDLPSLIVHECHLKGLPTLHFNELLLLFDALNEMPAATYTSRVEMIEEWLQANGSAHVIISSRERDYRERQKLSIPTVEVYPLDERRAKRLLDAYLGAADAENLFSQLAPKPGRRSNRDLIHLAQNPYLLTMMAYVYRNFGALPSSRGQLFQLFVRILYQREEAHHATEGISFNEMLQAFGGLAFSMQQRRSATAVPTSWAANQGVNSFIPLRRLSLAI